MQEQFQDRFVAVISRTSQPERQQQQQQQQQTKNTQETTKNNQYYGDLTVINRDLIKKNKQLSQHVVGFETRAAKSNRTTGRNKIRI